MEEFSATQIATTLGRIWCEELEGIVDLDLLSPQNGYEIISRAASGNWINYLMGKEIEKDFCKISQLTSKFYEVDRLPEEIFSIIVERVKHEYKEHPRMHRSEEQDNERSGDR